MKRIILFVVMLLMVSVASAQEGKTIYNKYSGYKDVSAVYISPAMFRMIGNLPDLQVETGNGGTMNLAPLISTFKGFYLLDINNASVMESISNEVKSMLNNGRYEILMELKDQEDTMQIMTAGDDKIIESFVFMASDGESFQFICIDGAMERAEVEKLILTAIQS